jgi:hypothetical protein
MGGGGALCRLGNRRYAMTSRERLPNPRRCESFESAHAGLNFTLCAGFYLDGRMPSHKPGSPIAAITRDAAVTVSIALQYRADPETIPGALTRDHDGGPLDSLRVGEASQ